MSLTHQQIVEAVRRDVNAAIRDVNTKMGAIVAGPWDGVVHVIGLLGTRTLQRLPLPWDETWNRLHRCRRGRWW